MKTFNQDFSKYSCEVFGSQFTIMVGQVTFLNGKLS